MRKMKLAVTTANDMLDELGAKFTLGGTIEMRTGAAPATPETAASGSLLITYTLPAPAFAAAAASSLGALGAPYLAVATGTGTLGHARFKDSVGAAILDMDVVVARHIADTDAGADTMTTSVAHGFVANQPLVIFDGSQVSSVQYVIVVDATTIQLAADIGGVAQAMPASGTYTTAYLRDARYVISLAAASAAVATGDSIVLPEYGVTI